MRNRESILHPRKKGFRQDFVTRNVDCFIVITYGAFMNSKELKRWLAEQGCTFESHRGGSGHLTVILGDRTSQLPMHGQKEIGKGLLQKICKDLGLK